MDGSLLSGSLVAADVSFVSDTKGNNNVITMHNIFDKS